MQEPQLEQTQIVLKCLRCGNQWTLIRTGKPPIQCPSCRLRKWDKPKPFGAVFRSETAMTNQRARWYLKDFLRVHDERELPFWTPDCILCGSEDEYEWHHFDYSKPLEVVKLCVKCHKKRKFKD